MPGSGPGLGKPINTTALEQVKAELVGSSSPNPGSLRHELPHKALVEQVHHQWYRMSCLPQHAKDRGEETA